MFSELTAPANVRKRRILVGAWLLHAALWLALGFVLILLRQAIAEEALSLGQDDPSGVVGQARFQNLLDQAKALDRFSIYATVLCVALFAMGVFWAWKLLSQRPQAWRVGIAWVGFEYLGLCWVIKLIASATDAQGASPLPAGDRPWMVGFLLLQMLVMGAIPFLHLWSRRAYELRPGEHSDAQRFKWWLGEHAERLFKRRAPQPPPLDQRPAPPPIPEDIERRHMWPSAPLPPPDDDHLRS